MSDESRAVPSPLGAALGPYANLTLEQRTALWEHYRRCDAMWRHWTPTIWSMPSLASAISIGAYTLIQANSAYRAAVLFVLVLLNITIAFGLWKHRYLQRAFGARLLEVERFSGLPTIEFTRVHQRVSGSWVYVLTMVLLTLLSLFLFIAEAF